MPRAVSLAGLGFALALAALWLAGALDGLPGWLAGAQRAAQDSLAGAIRSLRGGEPGALAAFWAVCFSYGVLHAAGPGHGKLLIGGYGVARRVPMGRLAGLALASSLAQAAVAVGLVYAVVAGLGLSRLAVEGMAERWMTPASYVMIAGLGLWLAWRGGKGLRVAGDRKHAHAHEHDHGHGHGHDHDHDHAYACATCGHAHGPSLEEVSRLKSWRDGLALVAGIAIRPCSGALFVLILTWQIGIGLAGIIGTFVMGLGTGLVTVLVAGLTVWSREGSLSGWELGGGRVARLLPVVELTIGGVIAASALTLLARWL